MVSKVREMSDGDGESGSMDWVPSTSCRVETDWLPRLRFHVELNASEYTVSWRRLNRMVPPGMGSSPKSVALEARLDALPAPEPMKKTDRLHDAMGRIERLYQGGSDNEENDVERRRRPFAELEEAEDEDGQGTDAEDEMEEGGKAKRVEQYDTDDPFIDDEDLNDYFAVDMKLMKHKGFFINKGELSSEDEMPLTTKQKKKKRVRNGEQEEEGSAKKKVKVRSTARATKKKQDKEQSEPGVDSSTAPAKKIDAPSSARKKKTAEDGEDVFVKTKTLSRRKVKGTAAAKESPAATADKVSNENMEPAAAKQLLTESFTENGSVELAAAKEPLAERNNDMEVDGVTTKPEVQEGNAPRRVSNPKVASLDRAVQDLEKEVMQRCPRTSEPNDNVQELPTEVKRKLARAAKLAEKQKKLTDEFYERLMGFLEHMTSMSALKHDIQDMLECAQTAEEEKKLKLDNLKLELKNMIAARLSNHEASSSAGRSMSADIVILQETSSKGEQATEFTWDAELEDRLVDIYDVHVRGMYEHKGAPTRKFYSTLVELWPEGVTDSESVKAAVTRAKARRKDAERLAKQEEKKRKVASRAPKRKKKENNEAEGVKQERPRVDEEKHNETTESETENENRA